MRISSTPASSSARVSRRSAAGRCAAPDAWAPSGSWPASKASPPRSGRASVPIPDGPSLHERPRLSGDGRSTRRLTPVSAPLLEVEGLTVEFGRPDAPLRAVDGVDFAIAPGETLALVGEPGSGKTLSALATVRLLPPGARITRGSIRLGGRELLTLSEQAMTDVRGARIGVVFQEPQVALNPVMRVGDQIGEVLTRHRGLRGAARRERVVALLESVGIPDP